MIQRPARSITAATALQFTLLAAVVLLVMGLVIRASVNHHFSEQDRAAITGKLELIRHVLQKANSSDDLPQIRQQLADALVGHPDLLVRIRDPLGENLIEKGNAPVPDFVLLNLLNEGAQPYETQWVSNGVQYRAMVTRILSSATSQFWTVVVAVDTHHHAEFLGEFERELALTGMVGLLLMASLGWLASRRGLRPVQDMAHVAEGISAQRLDERLDVRATAVELRPLARAFNEMLDRLGDSLNRLSAFSSDIAHELRTPINNLLTQTQVSVARLRTAEEYREVLYSNLEEFERLARMIEDMLFLAKADNGLMIPHRELVDLKQHVSGVFEFYDALAAEKAVTLQMQGEASVYGDPLMLRRAISNLVSNAVRHAHAGTTVAVHLQDGPQDAHLSIENEGETIAPEHLDRLFDRFFRVDTSRLRSEEGAGLGLAITRSIALAHNGNITATSAAGKTRFHLILPVACEAGDP